MRPVLQGDLILAARAVLAWLPPERSWVLARMLNEAHAADLYRKRLGRSHPGWGNGSLMARALKLPLAEEAWLSSRYLEALGQVTVAIRLWRARV